MKLRYSTRMKIALWGFTAVSYFTVGIVSVGIIRWAIAWGSLDAFLDVLLQISSAEFLIKSVLGIILTHIIAVVAHEMGHIKMIKVYGGQIPKITFSLFLDKTEGTVHANLPKLSVTKLFKIFVAGPFVNLFISIIGGICLYYSEDLMILMLFFFLFFFNAYPLLENITAREGSDGGRMRELIRLQFNAEEGK